MAPRVLKDPELRSARDDFKLARFYGKTGTLRKTVWFRALDHASGARRLLYGEDPPPEFLVELLANALREDQPLAAWMTKRTNAQWRTNGDNWRLVERALASVIVQDYLNACEDGRWTRTTND